jgi:nitronate monooxygenase
MSESIGIDSALGGRTMPNPYSAEMRERVIARVESGASRREAAEHFEISPSAAVKWLQRWRDARDEIADYLAKAAPATVLVAAGGVADGRGLAAALMLGADGALIGSRFWASAEALVHTAFQNAAIDADGDATTRTTVVDIVRKADWPKPFTARVMKTRFVNEWHGREAELVEPTLVEREMNRYVTAMQSGDPDNTGVWVGEAAGLIHDVRPAADLLRKS